MHCTERFLLRFCRSDIAYSWLQMDCRPARCVQCLFPSSCFFFNHHCLRARGTVGWRTRMRLRGMRLSMLRLQTVRNLSSLSVGQVESCTGVQSSISRSSLCASGQSCLVVRTVVSVGRLCSTEIPFICAVIRSWSLMSQLMTRQIRSVCYQVVQ